MKLVTVVERGDDGVGALSTLLRERTDEAMLLPIELPEGGEAARTAAAMTAIEERLGGLDAGAVLVPGDGATAPAASLVAVKLGIPAVRIGAGVRSGDRHAAAEINRVVSDRVCDLLLCADEAAAERLRHEGLGERTRLVGDWEADPEAAAVEILGWMDSYTSAA